MDDDENTLQELQATVPTVIGECQLSWELCQSFEDALNRIVTRRYDIVVTDIYNDSRGHKKSFELADTGAGDAIELIRKHRFTPILAITDGSKPENFPESPFIRFADKTDPKSVESNLKDLLDTSIPELSRRLHDELDLDASSYLWTFLEENWGQAALHEKSVLERLIRRRASFQMGRMNSNSTPPSEIETVEGLEFYIYPPITGSPLRLGELIRNNTSGVFSVVLTPHCHLTIQRNETKPRADFVLTVATVSANDVFAAYPVEAKKDEKRKDELRRRIQEPAQVGQPSGRYWFMPSFLDIPDLYCDFLQITSISYDVLLSDNYTHVAVIDTPFAESLQSCFVSFYSAVGLPNLDPVRFSHLLGENTPLDKV